MVCIGVVPKAPCPKAQIALSTAPATHCQILANTLFNFKKECSSQRNNNDNSYLLPAPARLWPEKRWEDPFDWS